MRSVITYLRYSSAIQGAEGADSTRRQNDLFKQWLKKNGDALKWHTEFGHLNRGDMLTSEQHRCSNEKKKF
ncbi:hypothetical protein CBL31_05490 [Shigella flexneri]|nr:hypothetical protein CBL31_05490 [Shigella flexneri]